jgi:predicted kinase
VRQAHLILITGLPGTGKSTLARILARRLDLPLICKDTIKEPLLDVIGATDRAHSRRLSDASFAVMFALARECLGSGVDLILEGNFRLGEHEAALQSLIAAPARTAVRSVAIAQVLCHANEHVRLARLKARATDPARHAGHRDADLAIDHSPPARFLALPGDRFEFVSDDDTSDRHVFDGGASNGGAFNGEACEENAPASLHLLFDALTQWRLGPSRA